MYERQTISLKKNLHREIKMLCVQYDIKLNDLVDKIAADYLTNLGEDTPPVV